MWTAAAVFLVAWITFTAGNNLTASDKGCYSTSFVQQYAFYYKLNQSLPLEECFAACNSRLTRYIGLQVDESTPAFNFVFCGNDLAEVSPTASTQCQPCQENSTYSCGGNGTMSVYLLRDSTPLSLLLATDRGVEMLTDNKTTLRVAHSDSSEYKFFDYIYTDDMIVSVIDKSFLRSFYNPLTMKYSLHYVMWTESSHSLSLAVDFLTGYVYFGYLGNADLYKRNVQSITSEIRLLYLDNTPKQISVDPYNRSLIFFAVPYDTIHVFLWNNEHFDVSLNHLHVEKINVLTMDIHEQLVYAILTMKGDNSTYLVRFGYDLAQIRVLFKGDQLKNAIALEVFRDEVIWISNVNRVSKIFFCKLTPRCKMENIYVVQYSQTIYDFSIYHPEKQTPGKKRLCASMTCTHGCQLFSPFTARCVCPPWMDLDSDDSTCIPMRSTLPSPTTSGMSSYESSTDSVYTTPAIGLSSLSPKISVEEDNSKSVGLSIYILYICMLIMMALLVCIVLLVIALYRKSKHITKVLEQRLELKSLSEHYGEVSLLQ